MRKRISFLLAIILIMCTVCSCESEERNDVSVAEKVPVYEYQEYLSFLENYEPFPPWFISYEDISFLGAYYNFYEIYSQAPFCADFTYVLIDEHNYRFSFRYYHWYLGNETYVRKTDFLLTLEDLIDPNSPMRINKNEANHWYYLDHLGVRYGYYDGTLQSVSWEYCGTVFTFSNLDNYPEDIKDTFIARLLNFETVEETVAEFNLRVKGY